MRTKAIFPILLLLAGSSASPAGFSAFADSQTNNSNTTTDPITQLFALIQGLISRITGLEQNVSALQQKTNALESRISELENSHQIPTSDGGGNAITILSNSTHNNDDGNETKTTGAHNDGHDNENDKENDTHNNGKHLGQEKHGNKEGKNKQGSD